eukprot:2973085-Lingulodinium_polyedra.AAC.1
MGPAGLFWQPSAACPPGRRGQQLSSALPGCPGRLACPEFPELPGWVPWRVQPAAAAVAARRPGL